MGCTLRGAAAAAGATGVCVRAILASLCPSLSSQTKTLGLLQGPMRQTENDMGEGKAASAEASTGIARDL